MHLMTLVFNNFWVEFTPAVVSFLRYDIEGFSRHSSILFPSQAKCDYFNFGSSGSIQNIDSICLLPQNVVNEKIFLFLYFWMLLLLLFSTFHIICVGIKLIHQTRNNKKFGYGFILGIYKKNLSPVQIDDLMKSRKTTRILNS